MVYSEKLMHRLVAEHVTMDRDLERLFITTIRAGNTLTNERAKEHILHGVARRLKVLRRCLSNVFSIFPPTRTAPLPGDDLDEVQISLHAFVINLYGLFENLAWAFVLRHGLEEAIGNRRRIGMFLKTTQRYLPTALRDYLSRDELVAWHEEYLKNYRDALAHRIPLYIPPAAFINQEGERFTQLEQQMAACIEKGEWARLDELQQEQNALGRAFPAFIHSFTGDSPPRPLYLHPQMLCDAKSALEFCDLYYAHWHNRAP